MNKIRRGIKKYVNILLGRGKPSMALIRGVRGSVTIFLLVIMLPMLVFSFSILDLCKIFLAKDTVAGAADMALRSAATSFDDVLKDMYGILATSHSDAELADNVAKYYTATLRSSGINAEDNGAAENFIKSLFNSDIPDEINNNNNFLKVYAGGDGAKPIEIEGVRSSAASNPNVLRRQIIEYMKYRGPVTMAAGLFDKINALGDLPNQADTVDKKLEFEKQASSLGDDAILAYTLLMLYKHNNDILYDGKSSALKGLDYVNEKKGLIRIYKYPYTSIYPLDSFKAPINYEQGIGKGMDYLKKSATYVAAVGAYSALPGFPNVVRKTPSTGSLSGQAIIDNAKEGYDAITRHSDLSKVYNEIKNGRVKADIAALRDACKGFSTTNHEVSAQSDAQLGFELLNAFAPMFEGTAMVNEDFSDKCFEFMSCYEYMKNNNTPGTYDEQLANEDYKTLYKQLSDALDEIQTQVSNFAKAAKGEFEAGQNLLNELYDAMYRQSHIIAALLGEEATYGSIIGFKSISLQKIFNEFISVKSAGDVYKNSIDNIKNENQQNSYMAQYNSEALEFSELKQEDVDKMVNALKKQKAVYDAAMSDIANIIFLKNNSASNRVIRQETVSINFSNENNDFRAPYSNKYIEAFNKDKFAEDTFSTIISGVFADECVKRMKPFGSQADGYSNWKEFFNEVTDTESNPFYVEIKKYGTPARKGTQEGEDLKDKIENTNTVNDKGIPSDVKTDGSSTSQPSGGSGGNSSDSGGSSREAKGWDIDVPEINTFAQSYSNSGTKPKGTGSSINADGISGSDEEKASAVQGLMSKIGDFIKVLAQDLGESALISEYFVDEFSCHTTSMDGKGTRKNNATMLTGYPFYNTNTNRSNVAWYGAEQEYILYGLDSPEANIAAAGGVIFGIRFALNLAYSFTDAEIRAFTLSVATAAGGVFPPAIPLIQTALHIGLAIAESSWDLMRLMDGAEVPIFKTPSTWVCKGSNIVREVASEALDEVKKNIVDPVIDTAAENISKIIGNAGGKASEAVSNASADVKKLAADEAEKLKGQIEMDIVVPLESAIQNVVVNYNDAMDNVDVYLKEKLTAAINDSKKALGLNDSTNNSAFKNVERQVMSFVETKIDSYASSVAGNITSYVDAALGVSESQISGGGYGKFSGMIRTLFNDVYTMIDNLTAKSNDFVGDIEKRINSKLDDLAKKAQNGVKVAAEDIKDAVGNVGNDIRGQGHLNIDINSSSVTGKTSTSSVLGMTYQDYLHIFMIISVLSGDTKQLERAGQLICANVRRTSDNTDFDLNKSYTVIGAKASASVKTVFWGAVFEDGKLKMPDGARQYSFTHRAYWGY